MVWCNLILRRQLFFIIAFSVVMVLTWRFLTKKEALRSRSISTGYRPFMFNLPSYEPPPSPSPILFLEGFSNDILSPRMLCSIESAAKAHNNTDIFVMMTSQYLGMTRMTQRVRSNYKNVKFVHVDASEILMNSPVKEWFLREEWKISKWPDYHFNDVLRWALLWKYGGIFMDMDVIVLKNLTHEKKNFACVQSSEILGMAAVGFSKGHPVIEECLRWLNFHFDGRQWVANGPGVLTNVLIKRCGLKLPSGNMTKCGDIKIYPQKAFQPIPWQNAAKYADSNEILANKLINDPDVFAFHTWNHILRERPIILSEPSPYAIAARKFCPTVVSETEEKL